MEEARQRVSQRGMTGVSLLVKLAFAFFFSGIALALSANDYHAGFHYLQGLMHSFLPGPAWAVMTRFGDERMLLVLSLLFVRHRPEIFWAMIVAALIGVLYARGLKILVDAPRPPAVLSPDEFRLIGPALKTQSFPSGHALSAFLFAGVWLAFSTSVLQRSILVVAATMIALSRVAIGVHWPMDIIAGAFGGVTVAALGVWITHYWQAGLRPRVHLWMLLLPFLAMFLILTRDGGNPSVPRLVVYIPVLIALAKIVRDYRDIFVQD